MPDIYSSFDVNATLERLHGQMNDMQRAAVGKARVRGRVVFDMWMGTGKTLATLASGLCFRPRRWLILYYKRGDSVTWYDELEKWIPEYVPRDTFHKLKGNKFDRQQQWLDPHKVFFVCTVASFIRDVDWLIENNVLFDVITVDEIHKVGLRRRTSKGTQSVYRLVQHHEHRKRPVKLITLCTGTWTSKSVPQRFAALHILNPRVFKSYWQFVNTYNYVVDGPFGKVIGTPKNTEGLALITSPYVHTVTEQMASKHLPPLQRIRLPCVLGPKIRKAYNEMAYQMFVETEDQIITVQNVLAKYTKLRQLLTCPAIIEPKWGHGDAIETVVEKIQESEDLENWKHNCIFTPYRPSIPVFRSYMASALGMVENDILVVTGGMDPDELGQVQSTFRKNKETSIIATIGAAQGWNAESALNVYFPHFDWDQDENRQAESRTRRTDGVQKLIRAYYVSFRDSITEDMFDILNTKTSINNMSYKALVALQERLRNRALSLKGASMPDI